MFSWSHEITSTANPHVKNLARLQDRRHRRSSGEMVIDGIRPCLTALRSGFPLKQLYACSEMLDESNAELAALITATQSAALPVTRVSRAVIERIACRENSDGIVATAAHLERPLDQFSVPDRPLLLLIEGVEKPGNLGAMLRTADGVGVDGVIICDAATDLSNPNVVRASMGTVFTMAMAVTDAATARAWLAARNIQVVAASPEATCAYWDATLTGAVAIAVGAEHAGLSPAWRLDGGDVLPVSIPMRGQADSLNVAAAAALMLYEALRQRSQRPT